VALKMSHSAARESIRTVRLNERAEKQRIRGETERLRPVTFRPYFSMDLPLYGLQMILCASLQAKGPGRQRWGILRQGHFMTTSKEKGVSEPGWIG